MAIVDINTLKSWFVKGAKPLATQFAAWMDSYWHKQEEIPSSKIMGLSDILNAYVTKKYVDDNITALRNEEIQQFDLISFLEGKISFTQLDGGYTASQLAKLYISGLLACKTSPVPLPISFLSRSDKLLVVVNTKLHQYKAIFSIDGRTGRIRFLTESSITPRIEPTIRNNSVVVDKIYHGYPASLAYNTMVFSNRGETIVGHLKDFSSATLNDGSTPYRKGDAITLSNASEAVNVLIRLRPYWLKLANAANPTIHVMFNQNRQVLKAEYSMSLLDSSGAVTTDINLATAVSLRFWVTSGSMVIKSISLYTNYGKPYIGRLDKYNGVIIESLPNGVIVRAGSQSILSGHSTGIMLDDFESYPIVEKGSSILFADSEQIVIERFIPTYRKSIKYNKAVRFPWRYKRVRNVDANSANHNYLFALLSNGDKFKRCRNKFVNVSTKDGAIRTYRFLKIRVGIVREVRGKKKYGGWSNATLSIRSYDNSVAVEKRLYFREK